MQRTTVRIVLDDKAYELALKPPAPEIASLHPAARLVLERAEWTAGANPVRVVRCTVAEARALLDYFGRLCDQLTASHDDSAGVCARARDSVRRALVAAGG
jgi:hypothetical protein